MSSQHSRRAVLAARADLHYAKPVSHSAEGLPIGPRFRAESFSISGTPHFGNPRSVIRTSQPGLITGVRNTGREGIDERMFRFGLRLSL